jgi:phospholipid transport system substrate-binding protein
MIGGGLAAMTRRFLLTALGLLIAMASSAGAPAAAADPSVFMSEMWKRAVEILGKKAPQTEKLVRFRELFQANFDGPGIARFVLGRYWRSASQDEQQEFLRLFEDYVVFVYGTRFSSLNGETLKIRGNRAEDSGVIVSTEMINPGGEAPVKIDWRLVTDNGVFKINDVVIEGISMMVTQRSEFASVIQRHGGQVSGLLSLMREKTKTASAAP